jgi:hypothetical protein
MHERRKKPNTDVSEVNLFFVRRDASLAAVADLPHFYTSPFPNHLMPDKGRYQALKDGG